MGENKNDNDNKYQELYRIILVSNKVNIHFILILVESQGTGVWHALFRPIKEREIEVSRILPERKSVECKVVRKRTN